ncbi:hypothetical protein AB0E69_10075 [Kribbella sp. NPDC026611]|uniref:hypothetical protein n=1 Tax=Kribbella sp. NPDC026611 TaxID=3154911 RepID=UPI0033F2EF9C
MKWRFWRRNGEALEPVPGEVEAAQRVVSLFATEALLALDRYEQMFPADSPAQPRETADELAFWWRELKLDKAQIEPLAGQDRSESAAEQILEMAAELALDRDNKWGVTIEEATAQAQNRAANKLEAMPARGIEDFRQELTEAYGGQVQLPEDADRWLGESLTRLGQAALLRDVVATGARVRVSEPTRQAAAELVQEGRRLRNERLKVAATAARKPGTHSVVPHLARINAAYFTYSLGYHAAGLPPWANIALGTPATAMFFHSTFKTLRESAESADRQQVHEHRLESAQAQLSSVRNDLAGKLGDGAAALPGRDARAIEKQRPTGRDR